jgi:hypothetical protein
MKRVKYYSVSSSSSLSPLPLNNSKWMMRMRHFERGVERWR